MIQRASQVATGQGRTGALGHLPQVSVGLGLPKQPDWTQGETSVLDAGFLKHLPFPSNDTS